MSLVRLADSSTNTYGDPELYTLKSHSDSSSLSTQRENFDHQYFSDSIQYICQPNSGIPGNMLNPHRPTSYHLMASSGSVTSNSVTDYLDGLSSDHGIIDCDEDDIRLKLQELERELLSDNNDDDDDVLGANQSMDIDCEWADSIKNLILPNSPKESSSSDSNLSSISSNKDSAVLLPVSSPHSSQNLTPKQLLLECAATISEGNMDEASVTITKLRQMVSIQGDPPQRIAAYMVEGLAARMAASGLGLYKVLKCKEPPTSDRLSAMQILFEICPCFKFGFMAANGAILEASKDEDRIHIIDFDINQGSQYMTLIQDLATRPGKRPFMRVTGVDDPESVQRTVGGLKVIGHRLEKFAESVGVLFDFRAIAIKTEDVTPAMLDCRSNEALVVNFAFQLHHMPDESVSTVNQRDRLLRMVKSLEPKLVTVVEQDVNTNTAPFFPRFVEAYNYYSAVFESLDVTLPRESLDRMNVERQCLARDIVNIVACEGEDRFERYEVAGKWRARMMMAGFKSCPLSEHVNKTIRQLLKQYCDRYKVKEECGALHFGWEDKNLIVASTWR